MSARKTWIKLKRGLLDPKHREAMGPRLWLYLHILDRAEWEIGAVVEWRDAAEAEALQMPTMTVRQQRRELEQAGYIKTERRRDHLRLYVTKWTNPREYSGQLYNPPDMAVMHEAGAEDESGNGLSIIESESGNMSGNMSGNESGNMSGKSPAAISRPSISITDSHSTRHMQQKGGSLAASKDQTPWVQVLSILKRGMPRDEFETWVQPTELLSLSGDVLTVAGANSVGISKLENGHRGEIEIAVREVFGRPLRVRFVVAVTA